MVYLIGVTAAVLLGLGYVLQQRVAATAPLDDLVSFRLLLDVMRRPLWWGGIAAMAAGEVLIAYALQLATVAVVEPLNSTYLLFALLFANLLSRHRTCWQEVGGAVLLSAALGVFIAVGDPDSAANPHLDAGVITLAVGCVAAAVAVLVAIGKTRGLVGESVLLAVGAGILFGLQDAGTRAALVFADRHGPAAVFYNPWVYIVIVTAVIGLVLSQSAFKAARLDYSLPPIAAAEPLVGVALGITLLGDTVSMSIGALAAQAACVAAMIGGVVLIARSPSLANSGRDDVADAVPTEVPAPVPAGGVSPARAGRADPR